MAHAALDEVRLVVHGADGVVVRRGGAVLIIPSMPALAARQVDRLLDIVLQEDYRGGVLLRRIAYQLGEPDMTDAPGFCLLVAQPPGEATLLAFGSVEIHLPGEPGPLYPGRHSTWLERRVGQLIGLVVTATGAQMPPGDSRLDLRVGIVAGSAVRLSSPGSATCETPVTKQEESSPVEPESPATQSQAITQPIGRQLEWDAEERADGPVENGEPVHFEAVQLTQSPEIAAAAIPLSEAKGELVEGWTLVERLVCSRGHFSDPRAAFCTECGIATEPDTSDHVSAPRPPLGVLIFDDGSAFSVDGDYVLGREPELDASVLDGRAMPLMLDDEDNSISRVHATIRLDGRSVLVEDRGSANGTFVAQRSDDSEWRRLVPSQPKVLQPGLRVRFGRRVALFESHVQHI